MTTRTATTLATLALLALPAAAQAADTPIQLEAGRDYMLSGVGDLKTTTMTLTDPGGTVVASVQVSNPDSQPGVEFRAGYSATYTIHTDPSDDVNAYVEPDCRGSAVTLCHLSINHAHQGKFSASYDADWFGCELVPGHGYVVSVAGSLGAVLGVRDERGRVLVEQDFFGGTGTLAFQPRARGRYFISVAFDDATGEGSPYYTVGVR